MNAIDYWYKKYMALKETERIPKSELTWKDIQTIIEIFYSLNKEIRDENFGIEKYGTKKYFTEILNRFNKSKEKE